MEELTRDDLVTILVSLQSSVEKWREYVTMGDDKPEWEQYDKDQLKRFQVAREKVEKLLNETRNEPTNKA